MELNTPVSHALRDAKEFATDPNPSLMIVKPNKHGIMALPLGHSPSGYQQQQQGGGVSNSSFASNDGGGRGSVGQKSPDSRISPTESIKNPQQHQLGVNSSNSPPVAPSRQLMEVKLIPLHNTGSGAGGGGAMTTSPRLAHNNSISITSSSIREGGGGGGGGGGGVCLTKLVGTAALPSPRSTNTLNTMRTPSIAANNNSSNNNNNNNLVNSPSSNLAPLNLMSKMPNNSHHHQNNNGGGGEPLSLPPISPRASGTPR